MACFWPDNLKDWVDVVGTAVVIPGALWGLYKYLQTTRLRAAEMLLKVEEEFRVILPTYEEIEDLPSYQQVIKPVLEAELRDEGQRDAAGVKKLTEIDRCLRFLYLCSVLNDLGVDRALGNRALGAKKGGALCWAYYYYIGTLLPEEKETEATTGTSGSAKKQGRPELFQYTHRFYGNLIAWVAKNDEQLREARKRAARGNRTSP